jgi:cytochrome c2
MAKNCCGDAYSQAIREYGNNPENYDYDTFKSEFNELAHNCRLPSDYAYSRAMEKAKIVWREKNTKN